MFSCSDADHLSFLFFFFLFAFFRVAVKVVSCEILQYEYFAAYGCCLEESDLVL